jgi:hypothetical protein
MKNTVITLSLAVLLLTGCGTYAGQGAYVGAQVGTILGSAVGGLSGGWRGSDVGTIVGMAGGAAIGAAIGTAADQREADRYDEYRRERAAHRKSSAERTVPSSADSGYDADNGGDDRVDFGISGPTDEQSVSVSSQPAPVSSQSTPSTQVSSASQSPGTSSEPSISVSDLQRLRPAIELRNVSIVDQREDGVIHAGEQCKVVFEIMNRSQRTLHDVQPLVSELSNNKHLHLSPNLNIESIAPGTGVRYTATILADRRLKDGQATIRVAVAHHDREQEALTRHFTLVTKRK